MEVCRERFRFHGIQVEITDIRRDLMIDCRAVQISQVLLNLLNNAHDAVRKILETLDTLLITDLGDQVEFAVLDDQPGVQVELERRFLLPFFTTKEIGKGTGLGSSVSKAIVEDHHGSLRLDSSGPHTRFVMTLQKRQTVQN